LSVIFHSTVHTLQFLCIKPFLKWSFLRSIYYCWHNRCKPTELKNVSLIHKIHDNGNDGCTKAIKYLFTINNLTRFAQHVDTISKMYSVFITSEMSICVPQKIHSTIYSHTFSFPIQLICFLCGNWWYLILILKVTIGLIL